ncbi:MAG: DNA repair protein RecN [Prevotellaceae bacterium]|jgi:DNA repair protein RecN (Recombination protein N)|nr:DNA repair protein RecN [Prevotellaceae bacterium]
MLNTLTIENYALIERLEIRFGKGLSIITGETGAGKSILLGALSLILGQRADTSVLKNKEKNCVVEGLFLIEGYGLEPVFEVNEIDYEPQLVIRRIISPSGKSRAFINDTSVTLNIIKEFGDALLDIHSQHQNLLLSSSHFQLLVVDSLADNEKLPTEYALHYRNYKIAEKQLAKLESKSQQSKADYGYLKYQFEQLESTRLKSGEQEELEVELKQLSHAEEIKNAYSQVSVLLISDDISSENILRESLNQLGKTINLTPKSDQLFRRLESVLIEIRDIAAEMEQINENVQADPERLIFTENRLNTLYALLQKHRVNTVDELLAVQQQLGEQLKQIDNYDSILDKLRIECDSYFKLMVEKADKLSAQRKKDVPQIEQYVTAMLKSLGMPNAVFTVKIDVANEYLPIGHDIVSFLFSANKDMLPQEISKVASGGEMSRLMLALKSLLVQNQQLPTIIFDEIDTGISGEVADKMGGIIKQLSDKTQVINITHLPQVAAKGHTHYVVYKEDTETATYTRIKQLNHNERVTEIAKMLSGEKITDAAIENAKELLKTNL